jgi:uncharacterized protein (TIRG00374 family)
VRRRGSRTVGWVAAAAASLLSVAILLRSTSPQEILSRLADLSPQALLVALVWMVLAGVLRGQRLRLLLPGRPSLRTSYAVAQIYLLITASVPVGVGEVVAAWLMRRGIDVPIHEGFAAFLVARLFDVLVLLVLFVAIVGGGFVRLDLRVVQAAWVAAAMLAGLVVLGALHLRAPEWLPALLEDRADRVGQESRGRKALQVILRNISQGLRRLPHGRAAGVIVLLTLGIQLLSFQALHILLRAAGVPASYASAIFAFAVYVLLRLLPFQGIGGIGTAAAWWAIAVSFVGVRTSDAVPIGATLYVGFYALLVLLCLTGLVLLPRRAALAR